MLPVKHLAAPWVARAIIAGGYLVIAMLLAGCNPPPLTVNERLQRASDLAEQRDLSGAVAELKALLILEPENADARWQLGLLYVRLGEPEGALKEIERAAALGLRGEEVTRYRLHVLLMNREFDAVLDALATDTLLHPDQRLEFEAEARFGLDQFEQAKTLFEQLVEKRPEREPPRIKLARIAKRDGDLALAARYLDSVLENNDRTVGAWFFKGDIALRQGQLTSAAEAFDRALALAPTWLEASLGRVRAALARGDTDTAERALEQVLRRYPNNATARYLEAVAALQRGDAKKARNAAQRALQSDPRSPAYLLLLGAIDYLEGDYSWARDRLQISARLGERLTASHKLLAASSLGLGKPEQAVEALLPLVETGTDDAQLLAQLANALASLGLFDQARRYLEQAGVLMAEGSALDSQVEVSDLGYGKDQAQVGDAFSAVTLRQQHSGAGLAEMMAALVREDYSGVLQLNLTLAADMPQNPLQLEMLGAAHRGFGDRAAAQALYEQAVALAPDYAAAQLALASIKKEAR